MSKVLWDFFSNLDESFLAKLPYSPNKYNLESVFLYYLNFGIPDVFHIKSTSEEKVFKIMENIEISKATSIENFPRRFLKDHAKYYLSLLVKFATSRSLIEYFLIIAKLKPIFEKGEKFDSSNYRPLSFLPLISKIISLVVSNFRPESKDSRFESGCYLCEPTLWLRKGIMWCTSRFYFRTIVDLYLFQRHASDCKINSVFIYRWLMSHVPT